MAWPGIGSPVNTWPALAAADAADMIVPRICETDSPSHAPPDRRQSRTTPLRAAADMLVPDWMYPIWLPFFVV
jgi:hypothetical protein